MTKHQPGKATDPRLTEPPLSWGVAINQSALVHTASEWQYRLFPPPAFDYPGPPAHLRNGPWFDYCVLAVSVLACLWAPPGAAEWSVNHQGQQLSDAPALFAAITEAMGEQATPDLGRFTQMTPAPAQRMFAGEGTLQLIPERIHRLQQVAKALQTRWDGAAHNLVEDANWDGPQIMKLLAATLPGYEDEAREGGHWIRFRKLAHLAAAMMSTRSNTVFSGLETFPVYPDYMLPRILRRRKIINYSPDLAETVDSRTVIPHQSRHEIAIRWATVRAGHLLVEELQNRGASVTPPRLDYFLWSEAVLGPQAHKMGEHHRTVTLAY